MVYVCEGMNHGFYHFVFTEWKAKPKGNGINKRSASMISIYCRHRPKKKKGKHRHAHPLSKNLYIE